MLAILQFNLPEDQLKFDMASKSLELMDSLETFQRWLAAMKFESKLDRKSLQVIEAEFKGILDDHGIYLDVDSDEVSRILITPKPEHLLAPDSPKTPSAPAEPLRGYKASTVHI